MNNKTSTPSTSRLSRRSLVTTGATGAAIALAGHPLGALADSGSDCLCGGAAFSSSGYASSGGNTGNALRFQESGNLPTPREQTVVIEEVAVNIWDSFNPYIPNGETGQYGIQQVGRECLMYANFLTGEVTPWLATGYTYNTDFSECTLKLDPKAKWNDGQPFTADDVVFSAQLLLDHPEYNGAADIIRDVASVEAVDANTALFKLTTPSARFHYRFVAGISSDSFKVNPKHIWESQDAGTFKNNPPVVTGPYKLVEASASKLHYLWQKNPDYWNKAVLDPKPEYFLVRQSAGVDAAVQEFLAGNLDVAHQGAGFDYLNQQVVETQVEATTRFDFPDPCPRGVFFNVDSPSGLFATPEGRAAFNHLIDRETIASTIWQPPSRAAKAPWADYESWQEWATQEILDKYDFTYDLEMAGQLLDQLGATMDGDTRMFNGKPLQLTCITPVATTGLEYQIGQNIANSAAEVGIDMQVKAMPGSAFGDAFALGEYDLTSHWLCGMQFDPNQLYTQFTSQYYQPVGTRVNQGGDGARTRLQSAELDAVVAELQDADPADPAVRPTFDEALDTYMAESPAVALIQTIYPLLFSDQVWTGWPSPDNPYTIPAPWWSHFLFAIGNVQPAASS
jgi:peptide/nickel transport system substrate-binding protein